MARFHIVLFAAACFAAATLAAEQQQAPRGWNSYNGWGGAINETQLLAVADFVQASGIACACALRRR